MTLKKLTLLIAISAITACTPATEQVQTSEAVEPFSLIGKITTSEGNREEFITLLSGVLAGTNCISCKVLPDKTDPNVVWVAETWPSKAAHDDALLAPDVQETIKKGRPMIVSMERMADTDI